MGSTSLLGAIVRDIKINLEIFILSHKNELNSIKIIFIIH